MNIQQLFNSGIKIKYIIKLDISLYVILTDKNIHSEWNSTIMNEIIHLYLLIKVFRNLDIQPIVITCTKKNVHCRQNYDGLTPQKVYNIVLCI